MITEKDMQYVLTIANYGNLTKAANALFLSQPALSIHLKQLETSLGIQLFERKGRRMILTYAGEEFVKSARDITMKCFELEDRMIDIGKNVAVKLRIGYMVRQVESLFPSVMTAFNRLYPQSVVYAIDGHLSDHEEQLLAGDLDMFFGYNSVSNTRLSYETIYEDCLVAILPKSHPAVSFAESKESCIYPWLDLAHVRKERFILQHSNQSIRQLEEDALFYADVLPELTYKISSIDAGIRLAEQGFGLRTRSHQTRESTAAVNAVNTETIAAQCVLHNANGRVIQLLRLHFVQFTCHRIHFAETVTPADNLPAQHTTIIEHIVVQVTQERKSFTQQTVFVTHESQVFAITQLHIPAYCAGNEIHHKRKPVRRVVKQRSE